MRFGGDQYEDVSALLDRRQRAREAYWDDMRGRSLRTEGIEAAIETATRVKVTPEIIEAARAAGEETWSMSEIIAAAFRTAGFEVEK